MKKLKIIYEDKDIIVVDKPSNQLTIATAKKEQNTLYQEVSDYLKKKHKSNKVFIIHRLDKDTSGVIIFAKYPKIKTVYQDNWNRLCKTREYIAIVEGKMPKKEDRLENYLSETKTFLTYVSESGSLAITNYKVIKEDNVYSKLSINIETGRKNQIRVQLAHIGNPIIGDKKYNSRKNPIRRLGLHANRLVIKNPITGDIMEFTAKEPSNFTKII